MSQIDSYRGRFQDSDKAFKYANRFAHGARRKIDQREQRAVRNIFSQLADCLTVLDIPSGAGRFLDNLGMENRRVIEMDVALEILQSGRNCVKRPEQALAFIQADASRLPLRDDAVDGVFCNRLLHHLPSTGGRRAILRELQRVTRRYAVVSFFDYLAFGGLRMFLKRLKGRKVNYEGQATLDQFRSEVTGCGFQIREVVATGPIWVAQKYFVLEKA
jgi:ubiquinone/menaquinone biosynthesis C-methylase UbiE